MQNFTNLANLTNPHELLIVATMQNFANLANSTNLHELLIIEPKKNSTNLGNPTNLHKLLIVATTQNFTKLDLLLICAILGCTKGLLAYVNRPVAHCCRSYARVLALLGAAGMARTTALLGSQQRC